MRKFPAEGLMVVLTIFSLVLTACGSLGSPVTKGRVPPGSLSSLVTPAFQALDMVSATTGWAASSTTVFRTTTAGYQFPVLHAGTIMALRPITNDAAWVAWRKSNQLITLAYTQDGGVQWQMMHLRAPWPDVQVSLAVTANGTMGSVLATGPASTATAPQALWIGHPSNLSSSPVVSISTGRMEYVAWSSDSTIWATLVNSSALLVPRDQGKTWHPVIPPITSSSGTTNIRQPKLAPQMVWSASPLFEASTGFLAGTATVPYLSDGTIQYRPFGVLYERSSGTLWHPVWSQIHTVIVTMSWRSSRDGWAVMTNRQNFLLTGTSNGGRSWVLMTHLSRGMNPSSWAFFGRTGWIVSQSLQRNRLSLYRSSDSGRQWQEGPIAVHSPATT